MGTIDWADLAGRLGTLKPPFESGGTDVARGALTLYFGDAVWEETVDYYVSSQPGCELSRSVLRLLKPRAAVERCLSIYREGTLPDRRTAVELLRVIAMVEDVPMVRVFLDDPDEEIQAWGIGVLDQMIWDKLVALEDVEPLLEYACSHPNPQVRAKAAFIRER